MNTQHIPLPVLQAEQRYSVDEAIALLRSSRRSVYQLIKSGDLKVLKQGRRTYVPGTELVRLSATPVRPS